MRCERLYPQLRIVYTARGERFRPDSTGTDRASILGGDLEVARPGKLTWTIGIAKGGILDVAMGPS